MNHGRLLACGITILSWSAGWAQPPVVEENLSDFRPSKFASWCPKRCVATKTNFGCRFDLDATNRVIHQTLCGYWFPAYTASEKVRVSFRYRGNAKRLEFICDVTRPNEKPRPGQVKMPYTCRALPLSEEWKPFSIDIDWPALDYWGFHVLRMAAYGDGTDQVAELDRIEIRELAPERRQGSPLLIGGKRATEIALLDRGDALRHEEDLRAARMFRYILYRNGGDYLPVRTARSMAEIGPEAVLIGTAAQEAGLFTAEDRAVVAKKMSGSCAYRVKGTRLGVAGELPVGVGYGVFAFWRAMGVEYLGNLKWRCPKTDSFSVADGFGRAHEPAIAYRGDNYRGELGLMQELRGRCNILRTHCTYSEGCWKKNISCDHNLCSGLVSLDEFARTRPDFFAMRKDGTRLTDVKPWVVQYCMSNPDLAELCAKRILEMMRLHPEARIFPISPGDGSGNFCKCPACSSLPITDIWVKFVNRIAEETSKEFPDNYVDMSIYSDSIVPPKTVKPHRNVIGHYCPYIQQYWPSCMVFDDPSNAEGWKQIETWRRYFPRLRLILYPSQCGENFNIWPSFDADNRILADFARHRAVSCRHFGYAVARGGDMPQTPGFCDLRLFVATRVEENPDYDPVAGAHAFIRDFYGAAAPEMTEYFEIFRAEAKRRGWVQNCEQHLKGFVTKEFGERSMSLLDAAERKLSDDPVNLPAVLHEKQNLLWTWLDSWNRGSGNVSRKEFPRWARLVAEFIRCCRETDINYLSYTGFPKWFHDIAFVDFTLKHGEKFFEAPAIKAILDDPEKGLGGEFPTLQKEVPGGCEIPARGMTGAQFSTSSWKRSKPVEERVLRRPTSGFGLALTRLNLKARPSKDVTLWITGLDNDHPPIAEMEVLVNGTSVFSGKVPWKKDAWTEAPFVIPAKLLTEGDNEIQIKNTTGDGTEKDGACGEMFRAKHNFYWGWFSLEKLRFEIR